MNFYRGPIETVAEAASALRTSALPASLSAAAARLRAGDHVFLARWDEQLQLGQVAAIGRVQVAGAEPSVLWKAADVELRPNPAGRQFWRKGFFRFADAVAERYMLQALCEEAFEGVPMPERVSRPPASPTSQQFLSAPRHDPGYVYVIRSKFGFKIGKSRRLKERTRLFEVKLPFPITVEMTGWFADHSSAERRLHRAFHHKRLEGEWFDLDEADLARIGAELSLPS